MIRYSLLVFDCYNAVDKKFPDFCRAENWYFFVWKLSQPQLTLEKVSRFLSATVAGRHCNAFVCLIHVLGFLVAFSTTLSRLGVALICCEFIPCRNVLRSMCRSWVYSKPQRAWVTVISFHRITLFVLFKVPTKIFLQHRPFMKVGNKGEWTQLGGCVTGCVTPSKICNFNLYQFYIIFIGVHWDYSKWQCVCFVLKILSRVLVHRRTQALTNTQIDIFWYALALIIRQWEIVANFVDAQVSRGRYAAF
jgi:hypothetical protein